MQQVIRQYAPDNMDNGGRRKHGVASKSMNSTADDSSVSGPTQATTVDTDLNTDLGATNLGPSTDADDELLIVGIATYPDDTGMDDGSPFDPTDETGEANRTFDIEDTDLGATSVMDETDADEDVGSTMDTSGDGQAGQSVQPETPTGNRSNGKTVLVTGATSGIGRELANLFAKDGYNLVLVARSDDSLRQIGQEYEQQFGVRATPIGKDLTDPNAPADIYAETQRQGLTIDILVNDAGVGEYGRFATESNLEKELSLIQLNISSMVHLTKLYLKDMVARNEGKLLLLGSIASVMPNPLMAVYGATKAFVYSFGEALRNELKDTNVAVTVLMPPTTDTDFFTKAGASHTVAQQQAYSMPAADVAKAGYEALMQGRDKVAAGMKTKLMVAVSHVMPDAMVTQSARNLMKSQAETEQERKPMGVALAIGAAVLGGLWVLTRARDRSREAME